MSEPEGDRPTATLDDINAKRAAIGLPPATEPGDLATEPATPDYLDDTEYPCDICGRLFDCDRCEHCSFTAPAAAALRTILQRTEANDGERLQAARTLAHSGDWASDAVVRARVRHKLRVSFGAETVEALLDALPPAADEDLVQTFAELEADDGALSEVLFPALAYRSRAVLAFGHRGQSKTSVCTWAARELSRAGLKVLVVGGDDPHTWRAALPRMGAFLQNVSYARAVDMARPGVLEKHVEGFDWIVVDNWRTWGLATDGAFDFNGDTAVGAAAGRLVALTDEDGPGVTIIANTGHHDESRSKGSAALEEAVHATRKVLLDGELSIIEPAAKTREGIDRDTVTLRARLDAAGRPEAYWLESRGPGVPTPDPDGTTPPKGWTPKHAEFLEAWRGENPTGSGKACQRAMKEAGVSVKASTFYAAWKGGSPIGSQTVPEREPIAKGARFPHGEPGESDREPRFPAGNSHEAEGGSTVPDLKGGNRGTDRSGAVPELNQEGAKMGAVVRFPDTGKAAPEARPVQRVMVGFPAEGQTVEIDMGPGKPPRRMTRAELMAGLPDYGGATGAAREFVCAEEHDRIMALEAMRGGAGA